MLKHVKNGSQKAVDLEKAANDGTCKESRATAHPLTIKMIRSNIATNDTVDVAKRHVNHTVPLTLTAYIGSSRWQPYRGDHEAGPGIVPLDATGIYPNKVYHACDTCVRRGWDRIIAGQGGGR